MEVPPFGGRLKGRELGSIPAEILVSSNHSITTVHAAAEQMKTLRLNSKLDHVGVHHDEENDCPSFACA